MLVILYFTFAVFVYTNICSFVFYLMHIYAGLIRAVVVLPLVKYRVKYVPVGFGMVGDE